jgi:hypothetical protein
MDEEQLGRRVDLPFEDAPPIDHLAQAIASAARFTLSVADEMPTVAEFIDEGEQTRWE